MALASPAPRSAADARLLRALGGVVRARRTARGWPRRRLADEAGVSERFLAELEAGTGNISVLRLDDVARALGARAGDVLVEAERAARAERARRDEADGDAGAPPVVALVGLRGAGKSAIGARLAAARGVPFVELDELVAAEAGLGLGALFELHGERYFRTLERDVLRRLLDRGAPCVLATGGSLVTDPETWGLLRGRARTVWLRATAKEHWDRVVAQGDARPMRGRPRARAELGELLKRREPLYRQADLAVPTSGVGVEEAAARAGQALARESVARSANSA